MDVYIGNIVHTTEQRRLEILPEHALGVNLNGRIEFLIPSDQLNAQDLPKGTRTTKLSPMQFLFPGFIDTHAHAPQYPNCGIFGSSTLLDWLETYTFPLERMYESKEFAAKVYSKLVKRQIANGTTFTCYFGSIHVEGTVELAKICRQAGVRAHIGRVCMQRNCPSYLQQSTQLGMEEDSKFCELVKGIDPEGSFVKPVITPRFAPSCNMETLKELGEFAKKHNLPVQTHISENLKEIAWVKELFPDYEFYAQVYDAAGLLKNDTVLAHAIHLQSEEKTLIRSRGAGISHCPNSNASIASGIAPVKGMLSSGLKVSLGTDVSGGSTVSILKNARLALLMSRLLSERNNDPNDLLDVDDALFLATLGGAQVLASDKELGSFAVGKRFDAQLIDITTEDSPIDVFESILPTNPIDRIKNLLQKWVYIGDDRNTVKVWVNGKLIYSKL